MSKRRTSSSAPERLDLSDFLPYRLSVLATKVSRELAALYAARFGITIPEWRVIAVLGQFDDVSADFVCTKTDMDRVTVSRAVGRLLVKRHVKRRFMPADRRCSMLNLTAGGRRVYAEIVPLAREYERRLVTALKAEDYRDFERGLSALESRLGASTSADHSDS